MRRESGLGGSSYELEDLLEYLADRVRHFHQCHIRISAGESIPPFVLGLSSWHCSVSDGQESVVVSDAESDDQEGARQAVGCFLRQNDAAAQHLFGATSFRRQIAAAARHLLSVECSAALTVHAAAMLQGPALRQAVGGRLLSTMPL